MKTNVRMYIYFVLLDYYRINLPSVFPTFRINFMYMYGALCIIKNCPRTHKYRSTSCIWTRWWARQLTAWNTMFVCLLKSRHLLDQEAHVLVFIHTSIVVVHKHIYSTCTVPIIGYVVCVWTTNWTSDSSDRHIHVHVYSNTRARQVHVQLSVVVLCQGPCLLWSVGSGRGGGWMVW